MLSNLCRLAVVYTLCTCAKALQDSSFRLSIGDGGYARLLKPAPSLGELTLAGWVNISQFPNGVAPILTAVAPDATSQVAFFLRHDGIGMLWGGPTSVSQYHLDQVDRHPRTQWTPLVTVPLRRKRRDAVDYSGGLGDIENIMADPRSGRSFDTWSPHSFVDVDTMGVADLEASPSGLNADLHLLPTRDGFSRSESYSDWTIVPYELTMQESDPQEQHLEPEPRIITEPSGDDDFVFFNWNVPQPSKPSIPQSPNEWSPIWQPNKENISNKEDNKGIKQPETFARPENNQGSWSSQVTEVKLGPNHWNPFRISGTTFTSPEPYQHQTTPATTKRLITTTTPQTTTARVRTTPWPTRETTSTTHSTTARPATARSAVPRLTTPRSVLRWRTKLLTTTTAIPPAVHQNTRFHFDISHFTTPPPTTTTTTKRPITREQNKTHSLASSTRQSTRMPLWKLIKQPSISHSANKNNIPTTTTTTTTKPTSTTTTTTTTQYPTTPRTSNRHLTRTLASQLNISHQRPYSEVNVTPEDETEKPQIMGQKSKVSIWSQTHDNYKPTKEHNHDEKWNGKSQGSVNSVDKHRPVSIMPYHVEEFKRAMEGVPTVKDGDTAVVYSVPITDVDAFNAMYEQYQMESVPKPLPIIRAPTVTYQDTIEPHEDETSENQLGENNLHFKNTLSYEFPDEPETSFEETASPAILTEEEAVLIPTEEPLPPTPSRSDIPVAEEAENSWIPSVAILEVVSQKPKDVIATYDNNAYNIKRDQSPVIRVNKHNDTTNEFQYFTEESHERELSTLPPANKESKTNAERLPNEPEENTNSDNLKNADQTEVSLSSEPKYTLPVSEVKGISSPSLQAARPYFSQPIAGLDESIDSTKQEKTQEPTTSPPQTLPTTVQHNNPLKTTPEKPALQLNHEETVSNEEQNLQSNNFAVFHITEDDIPIYPGQEETAEDVFSIDKLYQAEGVLATQEDIQPVSYYQEPSHLYHQQLPPEYKYEEAPRPIAYGGPVKQVSKPSAEEILLDGISFSDDPQKLLEQGLLPQPVHYVNSHEEADEWMQKQQEKQTQAEERVYAAESTDTVNSSPQTQTQKLESNSKPQLNAHFKKLPYNFLPNQWYHLAFTWSGQDHELGIYINGELAGSLKDVLPNQSTLEGGGLTILGQTLLPDLTDFDHTSQFIGEMMDINMFGRRLRPEAVRALYQCRAKISSSPALSWHQLSMRFYSDVHIQESNSLCGA